MLFLLIFHFKRYWGFRDFNVLGWNKCNSNCGICSGPNSNECTGCIHGSNKVLVNGECKCNKGYFTDNNECEICHSTWLIKFYYFII